MVWGNFVPLPKPPFTPSKYSLAASNAISATSARSSTGVMMFLLFNTLSMSTVTSSTFFLFFLYARLTARSTFLKEGMPNLSSGGK